MSAHMHRDDRLRSWSNRIFDQVGIDAIGFGINIDQYRKCIRKQNGARGSDEREVRHNYLVTGGNAKTGHSDFQSCGSVSNCEPVASSVKLGKGAFELQRLGSRRPPPDSALQNFLQSSLFILVVIRPHGKRLVLCLLPPEQCQCRHVFISSQPFDFTDTTFHQKQSQSLHMLRHYR